MVTRFCRTCKRKNCKRQLMHNKLTLAREKLRNAISDSDTHVECDAEYKQARLLSDEARNACTDCTEERLRTIGMIWEVQRGY